MHLSKAAAIQSYLQTFEGARQADAEENHCIPSGEELPQRGWHSWQEAWLQEDNAPRGQSYFERLLQSPAALWFGGGVQRCVVRAVGPFADKDLREDREEPAGGTGLPSGGQAGC